MHAFEGAGYDGKRRTQLVRGIGGELALHGEALLEPVERTIHRRDQRLDLARQAGLRQTDRGRARSDRACDLRQRADRLERLADRHDRDAERQQHEEGNHPGDVEDELLEHRMDQRGRAARPRHPHGHRTGGAVELDAEAVIVLVAAGQLPELEIGGMLGGRRPALHDGAEHVRRCSNQAAIGAADRENVGVRRDPVGVSQGPGQVQARGAVGLARNILGKIGGAQAELAIGKRVGGVVGAPDDEAHDDRRTEHEQHDQRHHQPELKRAQARLGHAWSTRR
jgi:hypothetical protein